MKKRTLSLLLALCLCVTALPLLAVPAVAAEDETDTWEPVFRFILASDDHINSAGPTETPRYDGNRLPKLMQAAYDVAKKDNVSLSGFVMAGDQVSAGFPVELETLADRLSEVQNLNDDQLPIYAILGNHEYNNGYFRRHNDVAQTYAYEYGARYDGTNEAEVLQGFRDAFLEKLSTRISNTALNYRTTIGSGDYVYPLILLSVDDYDGTVGTDTLNWLDENLAAAAEGNPGKPIFLICHYALQNTVTDSNVDASYIPESAAVRAVLEKYPQVIMSSGHTHRSALLPRTTWSLSEGFSAVSIPSLTEQSQFYMVETDKDGNVRFIPYALNGSSISQLTAPNGKSLYYAFSFSDGKPANQTYTDDHRKTLVPKFAAGATLEITNLAAVGTLVTGTLRIPQALAGATPADSFSVAITETGGTTKTNTYTADVWRSSPTTVSANISFSQGRTYTVTVTPVSAYGVSGTPISVEIETPTAAETKMPYTYATKFTLFGTNSPTFDATAGSVTFNGGWEMGLYQTGRAPLDTYVGDTAWNASRGQGVWNGRGGVHVRESTAVLPYANMGVLYTGYTAEKDGYLTFAASGMKVAGGNATGSIGYAIVNLSNGEVLWPQNAAGRFNATSYTVDNTDWDTLSSGATLGNTSVTARVSEGDIIAFVATRGSATFDAWGYTGLSLSVEYTHLVKRELALSTDRFVQKSGGADFPAAANNGITWKNNFTVGKYNGAYTPYAYANGELLMLKEGSDVWNADGGLFYALKNVNGTNVDSPFAMPNKSAGTNTSVAVVWTATRTGYVRYHLNGMKACGDGTAYAIVRNFSELLSGSTAFSASYNTESWVTCSAGAENNLSFGSLYVEEGDTIALLMNYGSSSTGWGMYGIDLAVSYTAYASFTTAAADVIPGAYKNATTSKVLDFGNSGWDTVSYPTVSAVAGQNPVLLNDYDKNVYGNAKKDNTVWISASGSQPDYWGKPGALAIASGAVGGYRYTAEKNGIVSVSLSELSLAVRKSNFTNPTNMAYAVYLNGTKIFPSGSDWYPVEYGADNRGVNLAATLDAHLPQGIAVSAGDKLEVLATNLSDGLTVYYGAGNVFFPRVTYTSLTKRVHAAATELLPDITKDMENGEMLTTSSSWSVVGYDDLSKIGTANAVTAVKRSGDNLVAADASGAGASLVAVSDGANGKGEWGAPGALMLKSGVISGYRYIARETGVADLRFTAFSGANGSDEWFAKNGGSAEVGYAIYVNGTKVWPAADEWLTITYTDENRKTDYASIINTYLPSDLYIAQGDCVEFLAVMKTTGLNAWSAAAGYMHMPALQYSSVSQRSAVMDAALGVRFLPVGGEELTAATIGGKTATVTKEAGSYLLGGILPSGMTETISLTWQVPATDFERKSGDSVTISHAAYTEELTYAGLLMDYANTYRGAEDDLGQAIYQLAVATLNYGAAAQKRFAAGNTALPDAGLTDAEKALLLGSAADALSLKGAATGYIFNGAACILRDRVQIKLLLTANTLTEGARLKYWTDNETAQYLELTTQSGGPDTALKAYLDVLPTAYGTVWHFQVVDASGTALSAELTYSVGSYAYRAEEEKEIAGRIVTMGAAAEAYRTAANAANA